MDEYCLVSCNFHDRLEALATLHQTCQIVYRNAVEGLVEVEGRIIDVYAANHADFLKLKDGTKIRLDKILAVDGKPVSDYF